MKIIKCLSELIGDELDDAKGYAEKALRYREEWPNVSRLFAALSQEEMGHMEKLHDAVTTVIKEYRDRDGDPPEPMMAVYNYLHEKHIEKAAEVRVLQNMYK